MKPEKNERMPSKPSETGVSPEKRKGQGADSG